MSRKLVRVEEIDQVASITLSDPPRRNALSLAMFDALDAALAIIRESATAKVLLLRADDPAFCAGFELAAAQRDPALMPVLIHRLSGVIRALRRLPQPVVASVQGAAIAGGCAMLSACDFVIAAPDALMGYPVHRIGVSPAVTIPTLMQELGAGKARGLLMSGELITAQQALSLGLVSHVSHTPQSLGDESMTFCRMLCAKGSDALQATKRWLNELDGSAVDDDFARASNASAEACNSQETRQMLAQWLQR